MNSILDTLATRVEAWNQTALDSGWLEERNLTHQANAAAKVPATLFDDAQRPLVVAFFGGTGVGKSTLLNRLAGSAIAHTSAERPTSREMTLYLHQSITISRLPEEFPVNKINQETHNNAEHKSVLWIDMPDFDSAETANRDLVADWLPHIDLLVYVVSPDRYRDDQGWRLLLEHGQRHAWVFVMNHWDRGNPDQRQAFHAIIQEAGLRDPLLFCTDCGPYPEKPNGDEFSKFDQNIQEMADDLIIQQLEEQGIFARIQETRTQVTAATQTLGSDKSLVSLLDQWSSQWKTSAAEINLSLEWKYRELAEPFIELDKGVFSRFFASVAGAIVRRKSPVIAEVASASAATGEDSPSQQIPYPRVEPAALIEASTLTRIGVCLDQIPQSANQHQLPIKPLRSVSQSIKTQLPEHFEVEILAAVERSLALPGTALQRNLCKLFGILSTVVPLLALGWAIYKLINSYASPNGDYLGFNFATHSAMMVAIGWFLPWFLAQKLRPTKHKAALRGMRQGVENTFDRINSDVATAIDSLQQQRQHLLNDAQTLFADAPARPQLTAHAETLSRVLIREH